LRHPHHRHRQIRLLSRMATENMPRPCQDTKFRTDIQGRIELILGPMFAGKTTELVRRVKRHFFRPHSVLVIKYTKDDRYVSAESDDIATHDGIMKSRFLGKKIPVISCGKQLRDVQEACAPFQVIAVDEGQFFNDIVEFSENLANSGKIVLISALDGDYQRKSFGHVLQLIPIAERVDKLDAVCMGCGGNAAFSRRMTADIQQEMIGKENMYMAVCRKCYNQADLMSPHKKPVAMVTSNGKQANKRKEETMEESSVSPKRRLFRETEKEKLSKY